jgi:hypothetical protein
MTQEERRRKIFDLYAANWMIVHPKYIWEKGIPEKYNKAVVCPLCLSVLNEDSLNQTLANPLTIEHIPPSELGGRPKLLLCKKCNNGSGSTLDFNIGEYLRAQPFLRSEVGSEVLGTTTVTHSDGKQVNARAIVKLAGKNQIVVNAQIKDKWRDEQLRNINPRAPLTINFKFETPSPKHVHLALLRVGYLLAFEKFGHAFILDETYNDIRKQILNPDQDIIEPFGAMIGKERMIISDRICVANTPFGIKSYLVVFTLKLNLEFHTAFVFLPPPFTDSIEFYKKFKELPSQDFTVDTTERFQDIDFLTEPKHAFAFKNAFRQEE